jgi:flagellar hook-length control protein FliK
MANANISAVGKIFAQGQSVEVSVEKVLEEAAVSFGDVMNSMAKQPQTYDTQSGFEVKSKDAQTENVTDTSGEYNRYQYRSTSIKESKEELRSMDDATKAGVENYSTDVREVLKEELNVTDEQIAEAMSQLGLTYLDLTNPAQLSALVSELTGTTDVGELLCSTEFLNVMQEVSNLSEALQQELGVTVEELTAMVELQETVTDLPDDKTAVLPENVDLPTVELPVEETAVQSDLMDANVVSQQQTEVSDVPQTANETLNEEQAVVTQMQPTDQIKSNIQVRQETVKTSDESENATVDNVSLQETDTVITGNTAKNNSEFSGQRQSQDNSAATAVLNNQNVAEQPIAESSEMVSSFGQQLDVENIIRQIVDFTKITVTNTETTMEMQLNPEHLGKIYLELTSKAGTVSAHITAQNEAVREALEAQIVTLKENLNQAGVKVDAVEVTVGSHEFERNLEQNAKEEERQAEEQEKTSKQTRNIRLGDLDELAGVMTEEETLVAQMMAEQGNSINFTA